MPTQLRNSGTDMVKQRLLFIQRIYSCFSSVRPVHFDLWPQHFPATHCRSQKNEHILGPFSFATPRDATRWNPSGRSSRGSFITVKPPTMQRMRTASAAAPAAVSISAADAAERLWRSSARRLVARETRQVYFQRRCSRIHNEPRRSDRITRHPPPTPHQTGN